MGFLFLAGNSFFHPFPWVHSMTHCCFVNLMTKIFFSACFTKIAALQNFQLYAQDSVRRHVGHGFVSSPYLTPGAFYEAWQPRAAPSASAPSCPAVFVFDVSPFLVPKFPSVSFESDYVFESHSLFIFQSGISMYLEKSSLSQLSLPYWLYLVSMNNLYFPDPITGKHYGYRTRLQNCSFPSHAVVLRNHRFWRLLK